MSDLAALGYEVDTSGLKDGERALDRFTGANKNAAGGLTQVDKKSLAASKSIKVMTRAAAGVVAALGAAFTSGAIIRGIAEFDSSMSSVAAVTRATTTDLQAMRDMAKDLGSTTEFSAAQAADGLKFLGMAGFSARDSIAAIPQVLDLATASGMGLAQAADTASNIMGAFGIAASDAGRATDILAAASSRANTDVAQLGSAMAMVGPVSNALGVGIDETAAAIGALSDLGIQGSQAGTGLRRVLSSLASATPAATKALQGMGLSLKDLNPETNSLVEIVERLRDANLSAADAFEIFGDRGAPAILALIENNAKLRELTGELRNVEGEAKRMADTMRDNLGGDIKGLQSAVSGLILAMGEAGLTAALRASVQGLTEVVRAMSRAIELAAEYRGYIIAAGVALTASYIPAIYGAVTAIALATKGTGLWLASLVTVRGALIMTGIGAFVVAAGTLLNVMIKLKDRTGSWGAALRVMGEVASGVWEGIGISAEALIPALNSVWESVKSVFFDFLEMMTEKWSRFLGALGADLANISVMGVNPFKGVSDSLLEASGQAVAELSRFNAESVKAANAAKNLREEAAVLAGEGFDKASEAAQRLSDIMNGTNSGGPPRRGSVKPGDDIATGVAATDPGGGGGGGGGEGGGAAGGGLSLVDQLLSQFRQTDPYQEVYDWYNQITTALSDAQLLERGMIEEHNAYKIEIEKAYQAQIAAIRAQEQQRQLQGVGDFFGAMAGLFQQGGERMQKIAAVFSAAQALINSWLAFTQALADPTVPFWGKIAAGVAVLGAGLQAVNAIRSVGSGGSGTASTPSASSASSSTVSQQAPQRIVRVKFDGPAWVQGMVEPLMSEIYEQTGDGTKVIFAR